MFAVRVAVAVHRLQLVEKSRVSPCLRAESSAGQASLQLATMAKFVILASVFAGTVLAQEGQRCLPATHSARHVCAVSTVSKRAWNCTAEESPNSGATLVPAHNAEVRPHLTWAAYLPLRAAAAGRRVWDPPRSGSLPHPSRSRLRNPLGRRTLRPHHHNTRWRRDGSSISRPAVAIALNRSALCAPHSRDDAWIVTHDQWPWHPY